MGELLCSGVNDTAPTSSNYQPALSSVFGYNDLLVYTLAPLNYSRSYLIHEFHKVLMLPAVLSFLHVRELIVLPAEFHKSLVGVKVGFEFIDKASLLAFEVYVVRLAAGGERDMLISSVERHRKVSNHRKIESFQFVAIDYTVCVLHLLRHSVRIF